MRTISGFARNGGSATLAYIKNTATTNVSKSKEGSWWRLQGHVRLATKQMSTPHRCHAGEDRGNSKLWGSVSMTTRPSRRSPHCSFREEKEAKRHFRGKGRWRGERVAAGDPLLLVSTTPPLFFCPYFVCVPYALFFLQPCFPVFCREKKQRNVVSCVVFRSHTRKQKARTGEFNVGDGRKGCGGFRRERAKFFRAVEKTFRRTETWWQGRRWSSTERAQRTFKTLFP